MIVHILKNKQNKKYVCKNEDENEKIYHIDETLIGLRLEKDINIVNIRSFLVWWCLHL